MLALTKRTEYALIAICHLARVGRKQVVSAREIHEAHGVPLPLLMGVLKKLGHAGLLESVRGARGGYMLALAPEQLSLAAVIEAVEGPVQLVRCADLNKQNRRCALTKQCPIQRSVHRVHHQLRDFMSRVKIADLAFDGGGPTVEPTRMLAE